MKKYLVLAGVLLTAILLLAATYNTNILPATTGLDLGSPTQQWDAYLQNVTVYGTLSGSGGATYGNSGKLIYCTGTFTSGHLLATDASGNCVDTIILPSGTTATTSLSFDGYWDATWNSSTFAINDSSALNRLGFTHNGDTDFSAASTGAINLNDFGGTGGVKFYDGQLSPSLVATIDSTGKGTFNGGIKAGASGSTISDTRALVQSVYDCGTTSTCANTANGSLRIVKGSVALASASPSAVTVTAISPAFTSTATYNCTATPEGNTAAVAAGGIALTKVSGSSFTLTGPNTVTTVIDYICIGN